VDFESSVTANSFRLPNPTSSLATLNGAMDYNTTTNMFSGGSNGNNELFPTFTASPTNGHSTSWVVAGSKDKLGDSGYTPSSPVPASELGALVAAYVNNSAASARHPFSNTSSTVCTTASANMWPSQGFLTYNFANTTSANQSGTGSAVPVGTITFPCTLNLGTVIYPSGGLSLAPGAAAGGYVNTATTDYQHVVQWSSVALAANKSSSSGSYAVISEYGAAFIAEPGFAPGILGLYGGTATTASTTAYLGFGMAQGAPITTNLDVAIPLPFAATLSNLTACYSTAPTANTTYTVTDNNAGGGLTSIVVTEPSTEAGVGCGIDNTHTYAAAAGDYVSVQVVSGATTQTVPGSIMLAFTPTTPGLQMVYGSINGTVTTTLTYSQPLYGVTSTTITGVQLPMPQAGTASNLYVTQAVANAGGVTTTFTLYKNGSATALTGTITNGSGTGAIAVDTTHTVTFNQGDLLTLGYVTGSGTSGTIGGWAFQIQ
jgi:hypothetical protein